MISVVDTLPWLLAALLGSGLAAVYFGGLWWTVRQLPGIPHPTGLYFGSLILRLALLLASLLLVLKWLNGPQFGLCLVCFLLVRYAIVRSLSRGIDAVSWIDGKA